MNGRIPREVLAPSAGVSARFAYLAPLATDTHGRQPLAPWRHWWLD